jgi:nucleoid-associated protein YgaU
MPQPEKAYIKAIDAPNTTVEFQFNPSKYSVSKAVQWKQQEQKGGDAPPMEFVQGEGRSVSLELFVDEFESGKDVRDFVRKLEELTLVNEDNTKDAGKPRPPRVEFHWAKGPDPFPSAIKSLNVTYTMFHPDGRPARATVSLALQEIKKVVPPQPGSEGGAGRTSHRVLPGETLDAIAFEELGSANQWKHIAELNNIDDPLAIRPGQDLVIEPPR